MVTLFLLIANFLLLRRCPGYLHVALRRIPFLCPPPSAAGYACWRCIFQVDAGWFQPPEMTPREANDCFNRAQKLQKSFWQVYDDYKEELAKLGQKDRKSALENYVEYSPLLKMNRRSCQEIVATFSNIFYGGVMHHNPAFQEEDFPLRALEHRMIFLEVDSANDMCDGYRNDIELHAAKRLEIALLAAGVEAKDIKFLSAYSLQADRLKGLTITAAQGIDTVVAVYSFTKYAKAYDTYGKLGLRGDTVMVAGTRAKSLVLLLGDRRKILNVASRTEEVDEHGQKKKTKLRQLLDALPMIPVDEFCHLLTDIPSLNSRLDSIHINPHKKLRVA